MATRTVADQGVQRQREELAETKEQLATVLDRSVAAEIAWCSEWDGGTAVDAHSSRADKRLRGTLLEEGRRALARGYEADRSELRSRQRADVRLVRSVDALRAARVGARGYGAGRRRIGDGAVPLRRVPGERATARRAARSGGRDDAGGAGDGEHGWFGELLRGWRTSCCGCWRGSTSAPTTCSPFDAPGSVAGSRIIGRIASSAGPH